MSAIGRKSLSQVTGVVLAKGVMWGSFHAVGKVPDNNERLKMVVTGSAISRANSFRMRFGIASGPQALKGLRPQMYE